MPAVALLFLLSIASTFALTAVIDRSDAAQAGLESTFCPGGWEISLRSGRARRSSALGPLRTDASSFRAYCVSPGGESDFCEPCALVAASPFLLFVVATGASVLWSMRRKPTALDHFAQLDVALGHGAISREQYDELKREVIANPEMTRDRFRAALQRRRSG